MQLWSFIRLNYKILRGVFYCKRLPRFTINYTINYVMAPGNHPHTIANTRHPPQVGDRVRLAAMTCAVTEVRQMIPPRGRFCFLQAQCIPAGEEPPLSGPGR